MVENNKTSVIAALFFISAGLPAAWAGLPEYSLNAGSAMQWIRMHEDAVRPIPVAGRPEEFVDLSDEEGIAILEGLKALPEDVRAEKTAEIIAGLAPSVKTFFREGKFNAAEKRARFLLRLDPDNGFLLYFHGETLRRLGRKDASHAPYDHYLEVWNALAPQERETGKEIELCYPGFQGKGYCQQRTGWLCHEMALDEYAKGISVNVAEQKQNLFKKARGYAECALHNYPPVGFNGPNQGTPTLELKALIESELSRY